MEPSLTSPEVPARNLHWMWTTIAAVVLAALIGGYWFGTQRERSQKLPSGDTLVTAADGKVIRGFPSELLLEKGAGVEESYRVEYDAASQPVVRYTSGKSLEDNIVLFKEYFANHGWVVTHTASVMESPITFFYAVKDDAAVNVTFDGRAEKLKVAITYVSGS